MNNKDIKGVGIDLLFPDQAIFKQNTKDEDLPIPTHDEKTDNKTISNVVVEKEINKQKKETKKKNTSDDEFVDLISLMKEVHTASARTSIMLSKEQLAALDILSSFTDTKGKVSGIIRKALEEYCKNLKKTDRETYDMANMALRKKLGR